MDWRWDPAGLAMLACGVAVVALTCCLWPRRANGGWPSVAVLAALAQWSLAYGAELSVTSVAAKELFGALKYVGIGCLTPAWVAFVLGYTGRDRRLSPRLLGVLLVEPVLVLGLLAVPATHDLVRYYPAGAAAQQYPIVAVGWPFWVHAAYTNVLLLGATGWFVACLARVSRVYWREAAVMIVAVLLPWVANLLYNFDVAGLGRIDFTPPAFALTAVVIVWGVYGRRLLGLSTIARSVVVETMRDAMVVLDAFGCIVDLNHAAATLLATSTPRHLLGAALSEVLPGYRHQSQRTGLLRLAAGTDGGGRDYEITPSRLTDARGRTTGELLLLRDVTERVHAEAELRRLLDERSRIARVLQDSLLPAGLPPTPGLDIATRYRPGGDGTEIGGDFFDVFALGGGRWAVLLGDVSGSGAEAAAMTALARYTVRALAPQPHTPRQMLTWLNEAMLRQTTDERYATTAYLIIEPHARGAHVSLALGGHPPPMLVRRGGTVEPVGAPGLVLGVLTDPELHDVALDMATGEVLCLYTDGVSEARRAGDLYGEDRLAQQLAGHAHLPAQTIIGRLQHQVETFADPHRRDDLALLVIKPTGTIPNRSEPEATAAPHDDSSAVGDPEQAAHLTAMYQPMVALHTGRVVAVEALARFVASERTPAQWFQQAAADGSGLTLEIAAAHAALRGLPDLPASMPLALNFRAHTLTNRAVTDLLSPHAHRLILELTDRGPVPDLQSLRQAITPLRRAGAQLAVTDVNSDYPNVHHVSQLQPDIIKLHHTIASGAVDDPVCRAFIAAVLDIAAETGARVIAQGVETTDQLRQLRRLNVPLGQGFLLGRPDTPGHIRRRCERTTSATPGGNPG